MLRELRLTLPDGSNELVGKVIVLKIGVWLRPHLVDCIEHSQQILVGIFVSQGSWAPPEVSIAGTTTAGNGGVEIKGLVPIWSLIHKNVAFCITMYYI